MQRPWGRKELPCSRTAGSPEWLDGEGEQETGPREDGGSARGRCGVLSRAVSGLPPFSRAPSDCGARAALSGGRGETREEASQRCRGKAMAAEARVVPAEVGEVAGAWVCLEGRALVGRLTDWMWLYFSSTAPLRGGRVSPILQLSQLRLPT